MSDMQRTKKSLTNLITSLIGQAFSIIISFITRMIFVKCLSPEYLGVNGLFTNILSMLSLVELGVGSAMTYSLYKPLAENNKEKIKTLMDLYKKSYRIIGLIILILGIGFTPFYKYLINDIPNIQTLNIIYILFVINTGVSYFYSYKRSLIICDQKKYIAMIYKYTFYFLYNIAQIIVLLLTKNFILYLICEVISTILENIAISVKADKMYPYLKDKDIKPMKKDEFNKIKKNVFAMMFHKVGGMVVNSTDNIILSKFVGIISVGVYSNYYMIINGIQIVTNQIFDAIVASVGNLGVSESKEKIKSVFNKVFFMGFWIFSFCSICLIVLFNDFIQIWIGEQFLFDFSIVIVIVIVFYLRGMRKAVLTFKDATGNFYHDRYKPLIESVINFIISIILVKRIGIIGIFLGTVISTLTTSLWIEPYVLYKYVFKQNVKEYFYKFIKYTIIAIIVGITTLLVSSIIKNVSILTIIIKLIICLVIPNTLYFLIFYKTKEQKYFINLIKVNILDKMLINKKEKEKIWKN